MFCPNCGNNNADGAKYCTGCGAPLTAETYAAAPRPSRRIGKKPHLRAQSYARFWKNTFRYGGTANRQEYLIPVMITVLIMVLELPLLLIAIATDYTVVNILLFAVSLYLTVSMFPLISLTVRRLRTVGRSGMWAGLILAVGIGTVILMWICGTTGSAQSGISADDSFDPSENVEDEVYGPPEWFEEEDLPEDSYESSDNMEECVYGPPEWFEDEADQ